MFGLIRNLIGHKAKQATDCGYSYRYKTHGVVFFKGEKWSTFPTTFAFVSFCFFLSVFWGWSVRQEFHVKITKKKQTQRDSLEVRINAGGIVCIIDKPNDLFKRRDSRCPQLLK